jgi:hypothetical protein
MAKIEGVRSKEIQPKLRRSLKRGEASGRGGARREGGIRW